MSGAIDLNLYLGSWYEIVRFNRTFERGFSNCKALCSLRIDGKNDMLNTGIKDGQPKDAKGKAKLTDTPRVLRASFFGPFYVDNRIMLLDPAYQWSLIGGSDDKYLWPINRTLKLEDSVREMILAEAVRCEYDMKKLIWLEQ